MEMTTVDSSNIAAIGRDPETGTVAITFKNKAGEVTGTYHYSGISEETFEKMRASDSIGQFFHANIKGNASYPAVKQTEPKDEQTG